MFSPNKQLIPPGDYDFPFKPYTIQQQLMDAVYATLAQKSIGIFESPTGTGKSLTLTCSVLRWLEDRECLERSELLDKISKLEQEIKCLNNKVDVVQDWITASYAVTQKKEQLFELRRLQQLLKQHDVSLTEMRERQVEIHKTRRKGESKRFQSETNGNAENVATDTSVWVENCEDSMSLQNQEKDKEEEEKYRPIQVFFCSRTHSQLAQVVREVKRTPYGHRIRCITLASRQQLCIHPQVRKLISASLINERCLDMAPKIKEGKENNSAKCCAFRKSNPMQELSETALLNILDIEELVKEGESFKACPYYAARDAVKSAQLVMLTYQMLLHRRTRIQTGIELRGAIVIIDEAHNLLDTIAQLHSCELSLQQLLLVQHQISAYKRCYLKRFSTTSLLNINQLLFVVKRLVKLLQPKKFEEVKLQSSISRVVRTYELTSEGEFYNIDLFALLAFCDRSRLAQKLQGFAEMDAHSPKQSDTPSEGSATKYLLQQIETLQKKNCKTSALNEVTQQNVIEKQKANEGIVAIGAPFRSLLAFIESLTEDAADGRVILRIDAKGSSVSSMYKYILLNPGDHFADVIRDARAIIVAGGTMQPTRELTEQLFRSCPNRVEEHFYDHVVSANAVLPLVVAQGPTGRRLCFNYAQRGTIEMLIELGMILQNICNVIPAGIVCFLPSYEYLDLVYNHLQENGILERISKKKCIFCEPRTGSPTGSSVERLLSDYSAAIKSGGSGGALLFSVVGGKLSEGLNFADDLGRCVVVIGMPYPNRQSLELQERMRYLDETLGVGAGNEYYENLCLKAVNQCIGRSVRHINDYACVLLVDERYGREGIQKKLPQWITRSIQMPTTFGAVQAATAKFFKQIKSVK